MSEDELDGMEDIDLVDHEIEIEDSEVEIPIEAQETIIDEPAGLVPGAQPSAPASSEPEESVFDALLKDDAQTQGPQIPEGIPKEFAPIWQQQQELVQGLKIENQQYQQTMQAQQQQMQQIMQQNQAEAQKMQATQVMLQQQLIQLARGGQDPEEQQRRTYAEEGTRLFTQKMNAALQPYQQENKELRQQFESFKENQRIERTAPLIENEVKSHVQSIFGDKLEGVNVAQDLTLEQAVVDEIILLSIQNRKSYAENAKVVSRKYAHVAKALLGKKATESKIKMQKSKAAAPAPQANKGQVSGRKKMLSHRDIQAKGGEDELDGMDYLIDA